MNKKGDNGTADVVITKAEGHNLQILNKADKNTKELYICFSHGKRLTPKVSVCSARKYWSFRNLGNNKSYNEHITSSNWKVENRKQLMYWLHQSLKKN